jgi:hypothetical protein
MIQNQTYPKISTKLIECLERDFPNQLPKDYVDKYELGVLIGQQKVIDKLKLEKAYNEQDVLSDE